MTMTVCNTDKEIKNATHILVTYAKISDKEKGILDMSTQYQKLIDVLYDVTDIHIEDCGIVLKQYVVVK